jgi:hypothetical protein
VLHAAFQLLLYGLLAGLSPVAFAATISVMPAGRPKVLGFGIAFVVAQLLTCSVLVIIGIAVTGLNRSRPGVHALVELVAAAALVWLAIQVRRKPPAPGDGLSPRTQRALDRLGRLRFLTTLLGGLVLGIGGPKRLVLTALAATAITTADLNVSVNGVLVVFYVAIASVLVWVPTVLFVVLGNRAVARMKQAQADVARRQPHVTVYALLLLAVALAADALGILLL